MTDGGQVKKEGGLGGGWTRGEAPNSRQTARFFQLGVWDTCGVHAFVGLLESGCGWTNYG